MTTPNPQPGFAVVPSGRTYGEMLAALADLTGFRGADGYLLVMARAEPCNCGADGCPGTLSNIRASSNADSLEFVSQLATQGLRAMTETWDDR